MPIRFFYMLGSGAIGRTQCCFTLINNQRRIGFRQSAAALISKARGSRQDLSFGERKRAVARNHKSCRRQAFGENKTRSVLPKGREQRGFCNAKPSERVQSKPKPNDARERFFRQFL